MKHIFLALILILSFNCFSQVTTSLDGSKSSDPDGGTIVGYKWTQVAGPVQAVFSSTTVVKPTVTFNTAGVYKFSLVVVDNEGLASNNTNNVVTITVQAANQRPIADPGPDQTIKLPTVAILNRNNGKVFSNVAAVSIM